MIFLIECGHFYASTTKYVFKWNCGQKDNFLFCFIVEKNNKKYDQLILTLNKCLEIWTNPAIKVLALHISILFNAAYDIAIYADSLDTTPAHAVGAQVKQLSASKW